MTTKEMFFIRNLASAVLLQAAKDYCRGSEKEKKAVLKDLNSKWMDELTDGRSKLIAAQLVKNADVIAKRLEATYASVSTSSRRVCKAGNTRSVYLYC
jgi:hypothetical protein